jgi:uncharacterized protein involved in response to NO
MRNRTWSVRIMSLPLSVDTPAAGLPPSRLPGALFNLGFRPFYLLAALLAAASLPLWVAQFFGVLPPLGDVPGVVWHAHEMVFGFASAVIVGFLFTAVRNWTGQPTPTGLALAAIAGVWIVGRIAMITGPGVFAAVADIAFLPLVAGCLWLPLHRARNRNRLFVAILMAMAVLNVAFHLAAAGLISVSPLAFVEAALGFVLLIVTIMAGRVVPMFTRNAVRSAKLRSVRHLDATAIVAFAGTWAAWVLGAPDPVVGVAALFAAGTHAVRLWTWDPAATRGRPILWILHVSYGWIPLGFLLLASALFGLAGTPALALHAFVVGAMGGMIIGMITRTARGHMGMALDVGRAETTSYVLVHAGAVIRVFVPLLLPSAYGPAIVVSAICWALAFAIYLVVYWPLLSRARIDGKPG